MNPSTAIRSTRTGLLSVRTFASTSQSAAAAAAASKDAPAASTSKRSVAKRTPLGDYNLSKLEEFQFDDATSLGFLRLEKIREAQDIVRRVDVDRPALQVQRRPFTPPTAPIRISQTIDLSEPHSLVSRKRVLLAPVARLPLSTPEAIHRIKLLAGPRWTPERPGISVAATAEESDSEGKEGWIKISEERFPDGLMNRKSASDVMDRLMEAANDPNSPLPADTPLDARPLLARQRKSRNRNLGRLSRASALSGRSRLETIGNVPGFPKEWLQGQ